jgi:hypothetical protein
MNVSEGGEYFGMREGRERGGRIGRKLGGEWKEKDRREERKGGIKEDERRVRRGIRKYF